MRKQRWQFPTASQPSLAVKPASVSKGSFSRQPYVYSTRVAFQGGPERRLLEELIADLMSQAELRRFVRDGPQGVQILGSVMASSPPREFIEGIIDASYRQGALTVEWFDRLVEERPLRRQEIRAVQAAGLRSASPALGESGVIPLGERRALISHLGYESVELDALSAALRKNRIAVKRPTHSTGDAMAGLIGAEDTSAAVIIILDHAHISDIAGMRALLSIYRLRTTLTGRVFVVRCNDAPPIQDALYRAAQVEYWQDRRAKLEDAVHRLGPAHIPGIADELAQVSGLQKHVEPMLAATARWPSWPLSELSTTGFNALIDAVMRGTQKPVDRMGEPLATATQTPGHPTDPMLSPTIGDLFSGIIELDRDEQWKAMLKAANQAANHALLTVMGHQRQSVGLFVERAIRSLSRSGELYFGGPTNRFAYEIVHLPLDRADFALPESAVEWLIRLAETLGGGGKPGQVIADRVTEAPLLVTLEPLQVERLNDSAWAALAEFATQELPEQVARIDTPQPVRLLVGLEFEADDHARLAESDAWYEAITARPNWVYRKLPVFALP